MGTISPLPRRPPREDRSSMVREFESPPPAPRPDEPPAPSTSSDETSSSPAESSDSDSPAADSSHAEREPTKPIRPKPTGSGRKVVRTEKTVDEEPGAAKEEKPAPAAKKSKAKPAAKAAAPQPKAEPKATPAPPPKAEPKAKAEAPTPPSGTLAWHEAPSIPQTIRASFDEAISYAQWMVDHAPSHPSMSVHEYRKTIRRLRAMVRLLRGIIDREALRSIDTGLRSAVLPTSGLRDARILLATLERVPPIEGTKKLRKELTGRWERSLKDLEDRDEEARVLEGSRRPLARLPAALADALPTTITPEELQEAVRRSYRRARRTVRTAVRVPEDAAIHRARKRVKELRYQLEWLVEISSKRIKKRQRRLADLAQELGEVTDFLVLEETVERDREGLRGLHPRKLTKRLRQILLARFDEVVVNLEELFEERSRDFAEGVASALTDPVEDSSPE